MITKEHAVIGQSVKLKSYIEINFCIKEIRYCDDLMYGVIKDIQDNLLIITSISGLEIISTIELVEFHNRRERERRQYAESQ